MDHLDRDFAKAMDRLVNAFIPFAESGDQEEAKAALTELFRVASMQTVRHIGRFDEEQPLDYEAGE